LLFLGHLLRDKGVYDLVRAFGLVVTRFPGLKLVLGVLATSKKCSDLRRSSKYRSACPVRAGSTPSAKTGGSPAAQYSFYPRVEPARTGHALLYFELRRKSLHFFDVANTPQDELQSRKPRDDQAEGSHEIVNAFVP